MIYNSEKIKILLIQPSALPFVEWEAFLLNQSMNRYPDFATPLGLIDLAAYLRKKVNCDIKILDLARITHNLYFEKVKNGNDFRKQTFYNFIMNEFDKIPFLPDIVGVSVPFTTSHNSALLLADIIKEKWRSTITVYGGNQVTSAFAEFLESENIDYIVRGEAEYSFTHFVKNINNLKRNDEINIKGIYNRFKLNNSGYKKTNSFKCNLELSPYLEDLDEIAPSAYDLLDLDVYRKTSTKLGEGAIHVMWSRGCPFLCTYCTSHAVHGRSLRLKSNDKIIEELKMLIEKYEFNCILIQDDLLAAKRKTFSELVDRIVSYKWSNDIKFRINNGFSARILTEDLIDSVRKLGVYQMGLNVESGSPIIQKKIKKYVPLDKAKEIIKILRKKDIYVEMPIILGFPGETKEMMQESIDFSFSVDVDWVFYIAASPLPGSEVFEEFAEMGVINRETYNWDNRWHRRSFDTQEIRALELTEKIYDTNIARNFFKNTNIKYQRYERALNQIDFQVLNRFPYHIPARYMKAICYKKLGSNEKFIQELDTCIKFIKNSNSRINETHNIGDLQDANEMYLRYKSQMPYLEERFEKILGK